MNFRYDIGFLRAIAVLAVVFFHFQIPYFSGGFIGVDIFFVISGFLMSSIIIGNIEKDNFSFSDFFLKRISRIVPALIVMLLCISIASYFLLLPKDIETINKNALFSLLFSSNITYYLSSGYFDPSSLSNFLLHTWSLSVEWQFYILYPILLFCSYRLLKLRSYYILLLHFLLIIASIGYMYYLIENDPSFSFYMFPTRAWEMLLGGFAFCLSPYLTKTPHSIKVILSTLSFACLLLCICLFDENEISWPSTYTLLPVVATFLIILMKWENNFFKFKTFQYIGNISYSWYLWHWPLFVFTYYFALKGYETTIGLIIISFIMANISYYFIEKNKIISKKSVVIPTALISLIIFSLSYYNVNAQTQKFDEIAHLSNYNDRYRKLYLKDQFGKGRCHIDIDNKFEQYDKTGCLFLSENKPNYLLVGDSHAGAISSSLRNALSSRNINLLQATVSTTYPLLDTKGPINSVRVIDYIYKDFISKNKKKIDKVIITAFWGSGQYESSVLKSKINQLINYLEEKGIEAVVIGQTPAYTMNYPEILALEKKLNKSLEDKYLLTKSNTINTYLKKHIDKQDYIDVSNLDFIKYKDRACYMYDDDHLSIFGANQLVNFLLTQKKI